MSAISQLRRSVYGVPPDPHVRESAYGKRKRKAKFWQKKHASRTKIHLLAAKIRAWELSRKEARNARRRSVQ